MAQELPLNGFYEGQSSEISSRTCVNYMPVQGDAGDLSSLSLFSTSGISGPVTIGGGTKSPSFIGGQVYSFSTGSFGSGGSVFCAGQENTLIRFRDSGFDTINLPVPFVNFPHRVRMASFSNLMAIINHDSGQTRIATYSSSGLISNIPVDNLGTLPRIEDVNVFGNRFIYMSGSTALFPNQYGKIYYSDVESAIISDGSQFFSVLSDNGRLRGIEVINDRLYAFGEKRTAVFDKNNNPNIPFVEQASSAIDVGLISPHAKVSVSGSLFFIGVIGGSVKFVALSGGAIKVISTKEIDSILSTIDWGEGADQGSNIARAFNFSDNGRNIVAFSFSDYTLCYDLESGEFHRRSTDGGIWQILGSGDQETSVSSNGLSFLVGSEVPETTGAYLLNSGVMSIDLGTEFGQLIDREVITSNFNSNGVTNRVSEIQVRTDINYSNYRQDWVDPQLLLSVSGDFGRTYGDEEPRSFGLQGVFDRLMRWLNVGVFRQAFTLRFRTNNPYPHIIIKVLSVLKKGQRQ